MKSYQDQTLLTNKNRENTFSFSLQPQWQPTRSRTHSIQRWMMTTRQFAMLAAVATRAQLQQEMMDEEEVGIAPKTLPVKKSAVAKPSTSTFAVYNEALLIDARILFAWYSSLSDDVVPRAT